MVKRLTTSIICAAALFVACDRDREPTGMRPLPDGGGQAEGVGGPQLLEEPIQTSSVLEQLRLANQAISLSNPSAAAEELPGMGHKFELFFAMVDDQDPDNATNDVISLEATSTDIGIAFRNFPPGIKIAALDDQINLKYFFEAPRTCFGGSPRITLLVDANGDGRFDQSTGDFAAQGHVNPPAFGGCLTNQWRIEDLTDLLKRWETTPATALSPLPCGPIGAVTTCTWDELEGRITTQFPNHRILGGFLLDGESCSFVANGPGCGKAYYDLVTLENRTLENDQDTVH
jgi:hypothetical protein